MEGIPLGKAHLESFHDFYLGNQKKQKSEKLLFRRLIGSVACRFKSNDSE